MKYACPILFVAVFATEQAITGVQLPTRWSGIWQGNKKKAIATVLTVATLTLSLPMPLTAPAPPTDPVLPPPATWQQVTANDAEHLKSVFYLVLDFVKNYHTVHVTYIGMNANGVPLFVGLRPLILLQGKDGKLHHAFDYADSSLVGYDGLIAQYIDIEEVAVFQHPDSYDYDITVLAIADVDMRSYQVSEIGHWPKLHAELELLAYRRDYAKNKLGFFAYPAMRRDCIAGWFYNSMQLAKHSCSMPIVVEHAGAAIFDKASGELVGFHFAETDDHLPFAVHVLPELARFSTNAAEVRRTKKIALSWGALKKRGP